MIEVDLNQLPPDRLRRFLEAFRVEIHYDIRTRRATFKAQISAETIDRLAQQVRLAEPDHHQKEAAEKEGPTESGGSKMIKGWQFWLVPPAGYMFSLWSQIGAFSFTPALSGASRSRM